MSDAATAINNEAERERAAVELTATLQRLFIWHDNFLPPEGLHFAQTNIGSFAYVGIRQPMPEQLTVDVSVTLPRPFLRYLVAVSQVPTSTQKVSLINDLVHRIARKLGAPMGEYVVEVQDPTTGGELPKRLAMPGLRDRHIMAERKRNMDSPYHNIKTPYTMTARWNAEGT